MPKEEFQTTVIDFGGNQGTVGELTDRRTATSTESVDCVKSRV